MMLTTQLDRSRCGVTAASQPMGVLDRWHNRPSERIQESSVGQRDRGTAGAWLGRSGLTKTPFQLSGRNRSRVMEALTQLAVHLSQLLRLAFSLDPLGDHINLQGLSELVYGATDG